MPGTQDYLFLLNVYSTLPITLAFTRVRTLAFHS